jgi:hypothetical protein
MNWLDLVVLILASNAIITAWMYDGTPILWDWHQQLVAWGEFCPGGDNKPTRWERFRYLVGRGADCRYCLSHHVPLGLLLFFALPGLLWPAAKPYFMLIPWSLAITHGASILHALKTKIEESRQTAGRDTSSGHTGVL